MQPCRIASQDVEARDTDTTHRCAPGVASQEKLAPNPDQISVVHRGLNPAAMNGELLGIFSDFLGRNSHPIGEDVSQTLALYDHLHKFESRLPNCPTSGRGRRRLLSFAMIPWEITVYGKCHGPAAGYGVDPARFAMSFSLKIAARSSFSSMPPNAQMLSVLGFVHFLYVVRPSVMETVSPAL